MICLDGNSYTDEAIPHLGNVKGLEELRLLNTKITDDGIKLMKKLKPNIRIQFH